MAGADDIVQNIVLAGQDEVIAGLNSIGQAGVQAFQGMAQAASSFSITNIAEGFGAIAAATGAATAGMFAWVESSAKGVVQMANFANEAGTTTGELTGFLGALQLSGNRTDNLQVAFRRLAVATESVWPEIQKSVRNAANLITADTLGISQATLNVTTAMTTGVEQANLNLDKAVFNRERISQEIIRLSGNERLQLANDDVAIATSVANVAVAEDRLRVARGGRHDKTVDVIAAEAALQAAQQAEADAVAKRARDEIAFAQQAEQLELARRQAIIQEAVARQQLEQAALNQQLAELQLAEAQQKQREDQANSIANLKGFIDDLSKGIDTTGRQVQLSTSNIVKGLVASVGESLDALKGFQGGLGALTQSAPQLFPVMEKVADVFKNITDETLRAALATALFGRGYSFTLVEALAKGSEELKRISQGIRDDFGLTNEKVKELEANSREFQQALGGLELAVRLVGQQFALAFAPAFTNILQQLAELVKENRELILSWGAAIRDTVYPIIVALLSLITGFNFSEAFNLSPEQILKAKEWKQSFDTIKGYVTQFVSSVKEVFTTTLPAALSVVNGALTVLSNLIRAITGYRIDPTTLGLTLLATQLLGINSLIISLAGLLVGLALIVAATLGSAGLLNVIALVVAGFAGLLAIGTVVTNVLTFQSIIEQWGKVKQTFSDLGWVEGIKDAWQLAFAAILAGGSVVLALAALVGWPITIILAFAALGATIGAYWEQIKQGLSDALDAMTSLISGWIDAAIKKFATLAEAVKNAFSGGTPSDPSNIAGAVAGSGFAEGGLVLGKPGIDTNLAWLTHLEYVMNPNAVKHYGVWFMEMINSMRLPKFAFGGGNSGSGSGGGATSMSSSVIHNMYHMITTMMGGAPRFALGGLNTSPSVRLSIPSLSSSPALNSIVNNIAGAGGGLERGSSSATRSLTLVLSGQEFTGLFGPANVVDALEKHAVMSQMSSTGYKPSWKS